MDKSKFSNPLIITGGVILSNGVVFSILSLSTQSLALSGVALGSLGTGIALCTFGLVKKAQK